jgi:N-methylhydantoinase B/oxoprolinase/acetone carboxylase alpha subunit
VGRPQERDPEAVSADVWNELVSAEMARNVYKVVVCPRTFEGDQNVTAKLRKAG